MGSLTRQQSAPHLVRGIGLKGGIALNMINMIGVGPFITLPLILAAMGGPQAMLGWILGAVFALCDGLIWAELGATFPEAGGSYRYLAECYGPKWGRLLSFLFVWQLSFSAPLSIASGCIGLALYSTYFFPTLDHQLLHVGSAAIGISLSGATAVAVGVCLLALWLAYRRVNNIDKISQYLWLGVAATVVWVIFASLTHFHAKLAFTFPPHAFAFSGSFFLGLGSAMLIATYDYWGYYNVGFLGGEIEQPEKNIPRAILWSVVLVAIIYIVMNIGVIGVMPWQVLTSGLNQNYVISIFMEHIYGGWAGGLVTALIIWTAFASVFALMLGYSRVPYAAATDGNYFKSFAKLHPKGQFPHVSLLWIGGVAALFCCFSLAAVIAALVVIRIALQFLLQAIGLLVLRARRPDLRRPFRMRWYPLPALVAIAGFIYVLFSRTNSAVQLRYAGVIAAIGVIIFLTRMRKRPATRT
ncbi:MAG: APC family permease [Acidobacteria bacterium]|nr:MAG: APC family permease [Acidobacteriota bacterium]